MSFVSSETRKAVIRGLRSAYPNIMSFDTFLSTEMNILRNQIITDGGIVSYDDQLTIVVRYAENAGLLIVLMNKAIEKNPDNSLLKLAKERMVEEAGNADGDPYLACKLAGTDHFVDRSKLRENIKKLGGPDTKKVLRVDGEKNTGRTCTIEYINHVFSDSDLVHRVSFDLKKFLNEDKPVVRLVTKICLRMGWDTTGIADRPDDIGDWLIGKINAPSFQNNKNNKLWLILDNCNSPGLADNGLNAFIEFIAEEIGVIQNFRLILLAKEDEVDNEVEEIIEVPSTPSKQKEVVREHLLQFLRFRKIEFNKEEDLDAHVDWIVREIGKIGDSFFSGVRGVFAAWETEKLFEEEDV